MDPKLKIVVPAAAMLLALTACGGGGTKTDTTNAAADTQANSSTAMGAGDDDAAMAEDADEPVLTGTKLSKAKRAALAKYPGTVLKAEEEAPGKAGKYGVWVQRSDGSKIEVFLSSSFKVVGTRGGSGEEEEEEGEG